MDLKRIISQRAKSIRPSITIKAGERVKELKSQGIKVIDLTIGEPDFNTPKVIKKALDAALKQNFTHYTNSLGIIELRQAISKKLKRDNKVNYDPYREILVTPGGKQAIFYALAALINKNDEVLIIEPCWVSYKDIIKLVGGKAVAVKTKEKNFFKPNVGDIKSKISKKTKALIINSPNNPTGMVLSKKELQDIAGVSKKHNLIVISDEIYEKIIFAKKKHCSIASLPGMKERTITINGFSKTYAMTGWRLGYMAASAGLMKYIIKIHQHTATCANSLAQKAAVSALKSAGKETKKMVSEYLKRRNLFFKGINSLKNLSCLEPEGTFYAFINIKKLGMNSQAAGAYLLEKAKIASIPGIEFGSSGEGYLRVALTVSEKELKKTIKRLQLLKKIKKRTPR